MIKKRVSPTGRVVRVFFELPGDAVEEEAAVVGSFNDWSEEGEPMTYVKSRDVWKAGVSFTPGTTIEFRYRVDGSTWQNEADADRYVPNPYFGKNSVVDL
ncbi:isoamylase early set domain-containing protein [Salisaeta longa]|uniref:isoamylase early set domain-containing protein n=1 Tax=Salisaeta longa TaxID=503170 RepID=UPI0003B309B4|nr:isoamylase early set domain-containing protein [Salisaeta longa]